ncbi:SDR family oxidoreductase [Microlunatus parietis]|uniref:NAD(P)H dehydrogenase (Quinone) n=1 Tax=Microlunatus parietis TaxID=682979 RepID=A0A7Y9I358_9ACTN|nr:SDR family oxidoreductase [Microlunatus parietis]NYE69190.1 NAD(P)H dehydrogenase (quinone) [Microlunatus parietis]
MTIAVTGATGQLGGLVLEALTERGQRVDDLVAVVRDPARAAKLAERGIEVRTADYGDPDALLKAFQGVGRLLFVSGSEPGRRLEQHRNVVDAAVAAGVGHLVYTSAPHADTSDLVLAPDHRATEELIKESGLPATILRNNWYTENYAAQLDEARNTGAITAAAGEGRVASAARADYAAAAAVVLTGDDHEGQVYELAGDTAWTYAELGAAVGEVIGREVVYRPVAPAELTRKLITAGLDEPTAGFVAALDANIAAGALADTGDRTLSRLLGRPTTPLLEGLRPLA